MRRGSCLLPRLNCGGGEGSGVTLLRNGGGVGVALRSGDGEWMGVGVRMGSDGDRIGPL